MCSHSDWPRRVPRKGLSGPAATVPQVFRKAEDPRPPRQDPPHRWLTRGAASPARLALETGARPQSGPGQGTRGQGGNQQLASGLGRRRRRSAAAVGEAISRPVGRLAPPSSPSGSLKGRAAAQIFGNAQPLQVELSVADRGRRHGRGGGSEKGGESGAKGAARRASGNRGGSSWHGPGTVAAAGEVGKVRQAPARAASISGRHRSTWCPSLTRIRRSRSCSSTPAGVPPLPARWLRRSLPSASRRSEPAVRAKAGRPSLPRPRSEAFATGPSTDPSDKSANGPSAGPRPTR